MKPLRVTVLWTLVLVASVAGPRNADAQQDSALVSIAPATRSVSKSSDQVQVSVDVAGVHDLAGFQFVVAFDGSVLKPLAVDKTQFIAQSGREIVCADPTLEEAAVRLSCVTLRETPPGVDGDGTIADILFKPVGSGSSSLSLKNVKLVHPDGTEITSTVQDGKITVSGSSWWTNTHRILVAAAVLVIGLIVAVALWRFRVTPSPTPQPGEPGQRH